eukprot:COSAG03_NODE_16524_length_399_cov_0.736667_2_plen_95_part_01
MRNPKRRSRGFQQPSRTATHLSISNPTPRVAQAAPTVRDGNTAGTESTAQKYAMAELAAFIKDDARTLLAFAPDLLTSDERNEVRRKAVLQSGYK